MDFLIKDFFSTFQLDVIDVYKHFTTSPTKKTSKEAKAEQDSRIFFCCMRIIAALSMALTAVIIVVAIAELIQGAVVTFLVLGGLGAVSYMVEHDIFVISLNISPRETREVIEEVKNVGRKGISKAVELVMGSSREESETIDKTKNTFFAPFWQILLSK